MRTGGAGALALVLVMALAACEAAPPLTAVRLAARPSTAGVDQLEVHATSDTGSVIVEPTLLPPRPVGPMAGEKDVFVYLDDAMGGHSITFRVMGLISGTAVDDGEVTVAVASRVVVDARVVLRPMKGSCAVTGPQGCKDD